MEKLIDHYLDGEIANSTRRKYVSSTIVQIMTIAQKLEKQGYLDKFLNVTPLGIEKGITNDIVFKEKTPRRGQNYTHNFEYAT